MPGFEPGVEDPIERWLTERLTSDMHARSM